MFATGTGKLLTFDAHANGGDKRVKDFMVLTKYTKLIPPGMNTVLTCRQLLHIHVFLICPL